MTSAQIILVVFYILLIILNYRGFIDKRSMWVITVLTVLLSTFMLFSANSADLDWSETELDVSGYRTIYEKYDVLEHEDFKMYYMFFGSMFLGQSLGLSFRAWWAIMSCLAMCVVIISCRIHKYSLNVFLATFMAYHEMVFYSGFKFFYGFCFLLLAYGFLFTKTRKRQLLFALFTCIAGGFHMMYYFFLLLLIKPLKNPQYMVRIIVGITIIFTVLMRLSGSAMAFLQPFFNALDNDHIDKYTHFTVRSGFYLALLVHLVVVYVAYKIRQHKIREGKNDANVDTLYYTVLLSLLFCPFYAVALTFMRLITAFSLIVVTAGSTLLCDSYKSRQLCVRLSLLVVFSFYVIRILMGGFMTTSVLPYFNVF